MHESVEPRTCYNTTMAKPDRTPTAEELRIDPIVQAALNQAWTDSLPDDPDHRHEEGGWIYQNTTTGVISIRRAASGYQSELNIDDPPVVPDNMS